jgi:hypothetical protein
VAEVLLDVLENFRPIAGRKPLLGRASEGAIPDYPGPRRVYGVGPLTSEYILTSN